MGLKEYREEKESIQGYESAATLAIYEGLVELQKHFLDDDGRLPSVDKLKDEKERRKAADKFSQATTDRAANYFKVKLEKDDEGRIKYTSEALKLGYLFSGVSHQSVLGPLNAKEDKLKLGELGRMLIERNALLGHVMENYGSAATKYLSVSDAERIVEEIGAKDKVDAKKVKDEADLAYLVDKYLDNGMVTPEDVKNKAWAKSGESN